MKFAPGLLAGLLFSSAASAAPIVQDFNAFIFRDFVGASADSEGNLLVGGNFNASSYGVNTRSTIGPNDPALIAKGSVSLSNGQITGSVRAGGVITFSGAGATGDVQELVALPIDFNAWQSFYTQASEAYDGRVNTGSALYQYGGLWLTSTDPLLGVFDLSASELSTITYLQFSGLSAGAKVILNVHGQSASFSNMDLTNSLGQFKTLLNFVDATAITFYGVSPHAEVLAPYALVQGSSGHIQGTVVAAQWSGGLELHEQQATYLAPPPDTQVPAPSTIFLAAAPLFFLTTRWCSQLRKRA